MGYANVDASKSIRAVKNGSKLWPGKKKDGLISTLKCVARMNKAWMTIHGQEFHKGLVTFCQTFETASIHGLLGMALTFTSVNRPDV